MKIFDWMNGKFLRKVDYSIVSHNKDLDSFVDEGKKPLTLTCDNGTEALLLHQDRVALIDLMNDWQDGILTIGTFGLDSFPFQDEYSVEEKEHSVTGEEPHPLAVKAFTQEIEEVFGSNNEAGIMAKEMLSGTVASDVDHVRRFVAMEEINGEDTDMEKKKKRGERTTLADLFSADAAAEKCNPDEIKAPTDSEKKKTKKNKKEGRTKHVRGLAKKLVPWKGEDSRPTAKLHRFVTKILKRKIHPELDLEIHGDTTIKSQPTNENLHFEVELININGANV